MTRILWADDQKDVVQTFSAILCSPTSRIVPVTNGVEALNRLKTEYFDLAIVDLMMPPDMWGGLWLLDEMQKSGIQVPVIVLSAEGTQSETIRALRLGAKDYVTKEKADLELRQRVDAVLNVALTEIREYAVTSAPTPLALSYKRYLNVNTPQLRLRRLIDFYEYCLRLCCVIGICEIRQHCSANPDVPRLPARLLRSPSIGTWNEIRQTLAKRLPRETAFFQLHNSFDNDVVAQMIRTRNDVFHGGDPSARTAQQFLAENDSHSCVLLSKLRQNVRFQLVQTSHLKYDGVNHLVEGHSLVGDDVTLPRFSVRTVKPVISDRTYLLT
ncbi:MAG: response regulator [Chloroflexi bacterium]|nr:response regulator [Chloroflexota bacterium]